jgi:hypothetical protein
LFVVKSTSFPGKNQIFKRRYPGYGLNTGAVPGWSPATAPTCNSAFTPKILRNCQPLIAKLLTEEKI